MIKVVASKEIDTSNMREFADVFLESIEDNGGRVFAVCLSGSHSIFLAGPKSDIDLTFHYIPSLENLLSLTQKRFLFPSSEKLKKIERKTQSKPTYEFAGKEYDPSFIPFFLPTSPSLKQLILGIYNQELDIIHKFMCEIPIFQQDPYGSIRDFISNEFVLSSESIIAYYSKEVDFLFSQIQYRNVDFHERNLIENEKNENNSTNSSNSDKSLTEIIEKNIENNNVSTVSENTTSQEITLINQFVKSFIYAIYAGLSCTHLLKKGEFSRDMWYLYSIYSDLFDPEEKELIRISYEHKTEKKTIDIPLSKLYEMYLTTGKKIKIKLMEPISKSIDNSVFPMKLSAKQYLENAEGLNAIIRRTYGPDLRSG
ncbi:MAG: hypothetical protein QXT63_05590 [Thermoplasmata archaeon]